MNIKNKTILITGANRGIGRALLEEGLKRGAKRVYAGTRQPFAHSDERVMLLTLDVTNAAQIQGAVRSVESLDILVNNAGVDLHDDLSDRAGIDRHLAVNFFGTHGVTQAFLPLLARSQGAIVNVLSLAALASVPFSPAYAVSKAAAFSMTQSLRALWAGRGVKVHAVFAGPVDTDMTRSLNIPKASPEAVAHAIFDGVEKGEEDIFPDPMSEGIAEGWRSGVAKTLERQFAAYLPESITKVGVSPGTNNDQRAFFQSKRRTNYAFDEDVRLELRPGWARRWRAASAPARGPSLASPSEIPPHLSLPSFNARY